MFNFDTEAVDRLCAAILSLKNADECKAFLEDVCTISEVQDLSQRLTAAMLLRQGRNYQQISDELGLSTATISRVNRCLNYGAGGYGTVLGRILTTEGGAADENK
ncbi:MAG: helix-turn-helix domain-containing protein [Clostridia bacterium]|nr:helix-turn-helix domain-containing protein [Clostridia bacterium]